MQREGGEEDKEVPLFHRSLSKGRRERVDEPESWQCFHFLERVSNIAFIFDCFCKRAEYLGLVTCLPFG